MLKARRDIAIPAFVRKGDVIAASGIITKEVCLAIEPDPTLVIDLCSSYVELLIANLGEKVDLAQPLAMPTWS